MIAAGRLSVVEGIVLLVAYTIALLPVGLLLVRRLEARAFERHVRARGARRAGEVLTADVVDVDPDLEEHYGTVRFLPDEEVVTFEAEVAYYRGPGGSIGAVPVGGRITRHRPR